MGKIIYPVNPSKYEEKTIEVNGIQHSIIEFDGNGIWMRKRAEMIMLRTNNEGQIEIFLQKKEAYDGAIKFRFPGGSVNAGESYLDAAIRECQEEALSCVDRNSVVNSGRYFPLAYIACCDDYNKWVKENIPSEYRWKSYFTAIYAGYYACKYNGYVNDVDRDEIATEGRWYRLSDNVCDILTQAHMIAIQTCW